MLLPTVRLLYRIPPASLFSSPWWFICPWVRGVAAFRLVYSPNQSQRGPRLSAVCQVFPSEKGLVRRRWHVCVCVRVVVCVCKWEEGIKFVYKVQTTRVMVTRRAEPQHLLLYYRSSSSSPSCASSLLRLMRLSRGACCQENLHHAKKKRQMHTGTRAQEAWRDVQFTWCFLHNP